MEGNTNVVMSPCAACKILRRGCVDKCILAPYFPPTDPIKFTTAHRVFGASNIIKFLQDLPEAQRSDAVSSMAYEASARLRDPVYGCAGAICHLQKQVNQLQEQLALTQAQLLNVQFHNAKLMSLICIETPQSSQDQDSISSCHDLICETQINKSFLDQNNIDLMWDIENSPLWD